MFQNQHAAEKVQPKTSHRIKLSEAAYVVLLSLALTQVVSDQVYGNSLGIYWDMKNAPVLQADSGAEFHNIALLTIVAGSFAVACLVQAANNAGKSRQHEALLVTEDFAPIDEHACRMAA